MNVLVDTDAWLSIVNPQDSNHGKAKALLVRLYEEGATLLFLPTTISEFVAIAVSKLGLKQVQAVIQPMTSPLDHLILPMDEKLTDEAIETFLTQTSKGESLFDCFVMAAARKYKTDAIFSFDKGYKKTKNDFKLVEDLFPNVNW